MTIINLIILALHLVKLSTTLSDWSEYFGSNVTISMYHNNTTFCNDALLTCRLKGPESNSTLFSWTINGRLIILEDDLYSWAMKRVNRTYDTNRSGEEFVRI